LFKFKKDDKEKSTIMGEFAKKFEVILEAKSDRERMEIIG
jgi:hypothetical protein